MNIARNLQTLGPLESSGTEGFRNFANGDLVILAWRQMKHEIVGAALEFEYTKTSIDSGRTFVWCSNYSFPDFT